MSPQPSFTLKYSIPILFFVLLQLTMAETSKDLAHFEYDRSALLNVKELSSQDRGGVTVHDITYESPRGGLVPAYLVVPSGKGKFAGVVWGHWMMPNSPTANRSEFLEEAIALAPVGVISVLIDSPYVRPGFKEDPDPFGSQAPDTVAQEVVDLRRAADLLLARDDVDPKRIGYVGHSFDANCGAILDAVDKRFTTFVFMGNPQSTRDFVLNSNSPNMTAFRKSVPIDKLTSYLDKHEWADPGAYVSYLGPAPALFQYAMHDQFVEVSAAKHYFESSAGPKEIRFYDSDHALNGNARIDRIDFLCKQLLLSSLSSRILDTIPQTK